MDLAAEDVLFLSRIVFYLITCVLGCYINYFLLSEFIEYCKYKCETIKSDYYKNFAYNIGELVVAAMITSLGIVLQCCLVVYVLESVLLR